MLDYPRIAEALCEGRLSYSKVRAITRVVTPETEKTLLDLASGVPASQIERVVAGRKRVDILEGEITPQSIASEWDGTPLTELLLSETVHGLLWQEGCFRDEVEAMWAARAAVECESLVGCEPDDTDVVA